MHIPLYPIERGVGSSVRGGASQYRGQPPPRAWRQVPSRRLAVRQRYQAGKARAHTCMVRATVVYITTTHKKDKWIPFSLRKKKAYISPFLLFFFFFLCSPLPPPPTPPPFSHMWHGQLRRCYSIYGNMQLLSTYNAHSLARNNHKENGKEQTIETKDHKYYL